jgi:hypothetical protein
MGLFSRDAPKGMTRSQMQAQVLQGLKIINDSANLVNTTVKADVFFKRLNILLDTLMGLSRYEKYKAFKKSTPTKQIQEILRDLDKTVDKFIDRSIAAESAVVDALKTDKAKITRWEKFEDKTLKQFSDAHAQWSGSYLPSTGALPHYTDALYHQSSIDYLKAEIQRHKQALQ